ncbi:MAG: tRNA (adenosine(37)-N6)-threonylcarbamoyltransferase complex ATPase subunit type 1 TsaE [Verrucomicrobiae bacterium]|nr:tRNA (adenosine(37)-N6)-threonylcarbamoyltransferase complex ATPase subunit type 1 TsaE [Verrucomicrobiae bacterium]
MSQDRDIQNEAAMLAFGAEIAAELKAGDVLALVGQLGAGKTHFSKGIVEGLGGDPVAVTSPTFTLVHEYATDCRVPVFHFDFYRLDSASELLGIGWDDYLDEAEGVLLVEWADKFPELLPPNTRWFRFEIIENGVRRCTTEN